LVPEKKTNHLKSGGAWVKPRLTPVKNDTPQSASTTASDEEEPQLTTPMKYDGKLLINETGGVIKFGTSETTKEEVSKLQGHYELLGPTQNVELPKDAVVLKLNPIMKPDGSRRFITQCPTKTLEKKKAQIPPEIKSINPHLDLRGTIIKLIHDFAEIQGKDKDVLIFDLSNAYARIRCKSSNLFFETKDKFLYKLNQPVQGLASAGVIAPHVLYNYFKKLIRKVRKRLRKKSKQARIEFTSYSDNCLIVTNEASKVRKFIKQELAKHNLENTKQFGMASQGFKTLGMKFKLKKRGEENYLIIRRKETAKPERQQYYNYILGQRPYILVEEKPTIMAVDGVSKEGTGTFGWTISQGERTLHGAVMKRQGIDQLISESAALHLGDKLRREAKLQHVPLHSDSEINLNLLENDNQREGIEFKIVRDIKNINFIPGRDNPADILTRDKKLQELFQVYQRKRFRRKKQDAEGYETELKTPVSFKRSKNQPSVNTSDSTAHPTPIRKWTQENEAHENQEEDPDTDKPPDQGGIP